MTDCSWLVSELRDVHTTLMRLAPFRDLGLVPNPAGSERGVARAEARLGLRLPPSYREFLLRHDGWVRFYDGARLFAARELGWPEGERAALSVLEAAETPVAELSLVGASPRRSRLIPIGIDAAATTVFALEVPRHAANTTSPSEYPVVAWLGELGLRSESFTGFLTMMLDLSRAEVEDYQGRAVLSRSA